MNNQRSAIVGRSVHRSRRRERERVGGERMQGRVKSEVDVEGEGVVESR